MVGLALLAWGCGGSSGSDQDPYDPSAPVIAVYMGNDVAPRVRDRFMNHLRAADARPVVLLSSEELPRSERALVLVVGNHPHARRIISEDQQVALGSEGFVVRSGEVDGVPVLAAVGNALAPDAFSHNNLGVHYAAYALLEDLGFGFLHPMEVVTPQGLPDSTPTVDQAESPHWPIRGVHLHTMHPLELTHVLNGWGEGGAGDAAGFEQLLPEWEQTCEWLIANRQNRVQWMLLWADGWSTFADSAERMERLRRVNDIAHEFGLATAVDVPLTLKQQNAFHLIRSESDLETEKAELRQRIDYVMTGGFDYLASENGTSEFTHSSDQRMVAWMDELARYLAEEYQTNAFMKVHASQGQFADNYLDPQSGSPLNINMLPQFSDARLGVMPHTVQHYALDDHAPTYGNQDFDYIRQFMIQQAGQRPVVWYPETAYWVSFDIDVPLFLPIYAERRFHDLRLIAADEQALGKRIDGQIIFSSGWEWGYWLNDVVTMRAAWNPRLDQSESEGLRGLLDEVFAPFGEAGPDTTELVLEIAYRQRDLLINGESTAQAPSDLFKLTGQAYLQGTETWDDVAELYSKFADPVNTQPLKLGLVEMRNPLHGGPRYKSEVEPLLAAMESEFEAQAVRMSNLAVRIAEPAASFASELQHGAQMNYLRAKQVHGLYDYVDGWLGSASSAERMARLQTARDALHSAEVIVAEREQHYRVNPERIAGWTANPTAYDFAYLWTVRSLHYWWRDEGKAFDAPVSPCYLNIISPIAVGFGEGTYQDAAEAARSVLDDLSITALSECLSAPTVSPSYPVEGMR